MPDLDRPRDVRPGDDLDLDALAGWLRGALGVEDRPVVHQYPSGFSNLTYLLDLGHRELVLRRPPHGDHVRGGHDMGREYGILTALAGHVPVPEPLAYEPTGDVLGAPFYVMEHVPGVVLRTTTPEGDRPAPTTMARVAGAFVGTFAALHAVDVEAVGLGDLGRPEGYVGRQVAGWERRYQAAATDVVPDLERAFAWLRAHQPPESDATLVHNDYKYDNLLLDPADLADVRAVLDWELATVGDPLMDLGSSLGVLGRGDRPPRPQGDGAQPDVVAGQPDARRARRGVPGADRPRGPPRRVLRGLRVRQAGRDRPADLPPLDAGGGDGPPVRGPHPHGPGVRARRRPGRSSGTGSRTSATTNPPSGRAAGRGGAGAPRADGRGILRSPTPPRPMDVLTAPDAPAAVGPYSHAVRAGGLVFCSGQVALDPGTNALVGDDAAAQARQVFANVRAVLGAAGLGLSDVVKTTVLLASMDDYGAVNAVYAEAFGDHRPARSAFATGGLPLGALVEVEVTAAVR